jgi:hypothetical protein
VRFLLFSLENLSGDIAGLVGLGPVDLRLRVGFMARRRTAAGAAPSEDVGAYTLGLIDLDRARMGLFLGNSNGRESVQDFPAFNFELSR